jgi:hypothetical protein
VSDRQRVVLTLEYAGDDPRQQYRPDLSRLLKAMLRQYRWRCLRIEDAPPRRESAGGEADPNG